LAGVIHTKYWSIGLYEPHAVFSHALILFVLEDFDSFGLLESFIHEAWARDYSGSLETRMRYTASDCFETFPVPPTNTIIGPIGKAYYDHRLQIMLSRKEGLTNTYNCFHDPDVSTADIQKLRDLHVKMDRTVAAAYGRANLDLGHGFHETKQGIRFTISESARREVLSRLLKLNHERYAEEVRQGLHDKKGKAKTPKVGGKTTGGRSRKSKASSEEPSLFDDDVPVGSE